MNQFLFIFWVLDLDEKLFATEKEPTYSYDLLSSCMQRAIEDIYIYLHNRQGHSSFSQLQFFFWKISNEEDSIS